MSNHLSAVSYQSSLNRQRNKFTAATCFFVLFTFTFSFFTRAQPPETPVLEQQLENITENNSDEETEDDSYLQQMQQFIKHPLNINNATADDLKELRVLTPVQIQNAVSYRNLFGKFIDIYELQAIPAWSLEIIQKIRPFITVANTPIITEAIRTRLQNGDHSILFRITQTLQKSKGFLQQAASNYYAGSPQKLLVRYKYQFKNLLQYGVVAEKDAGEQFFKGRQKQGFDFYSAHFFLRNNGIIKSLALGDFAVNLGQGLTQWQSLAFKKSADVLAIKREADVLRPYNSAGEIFFHRGAGITIKLKALQATFFTSYKNIDANFITDTLAATDDYVSSFQTSGYHRTQSEAADKGIQRQLAYGGNIAFTDNNFHFGINAIQYQFKFPLQKDALLYNRYALAGKNFGNYSADYSFTYKNIHFFGEVATNSKYMGLINGLLISAAAMADVSLVYRNMAAGYQSLYTNAFTENTLPANEKGLYAGIALHPPGPLRLDMYADFFKFPWLKLTADAPTTGSDYMAQLTYKPNKQVEIYSRFRAENKSSNFNPDGYVFAAVVAQPRKSWRTQLNYKISQNVSLRNRVEVTWFSNPLQNEQGFLGYTEVAYKPMLKNWSINTRFQFFDTESYNSRLYAYESDILYSYSIPVFYGKGLKYYLVSAYDIGKKATIWVRWAQIIYKGQNSIGSGLDEINGHSKSEYKIQFRYFF